MDDINKKATNETQIEKLEGEINGLKRWLSLFDSSKFVNCSRGGEETNINI